LPPFFSICAFFINRVGTSEEVASMTHPDKGQLLASHQVEWKNLCIWLTFAAVFFSCQGLLAWIVIQGYWWAAIPLVLFLAHLMHSHLLALHDAAHGTMCPNYLINEGVGIFIGTFGLIEFSLFRVVHHTHHAYLGTPRDEEMWPFVNTEVSRGKRRLAAALELTIGLFYTPLLLLRAFVRRNSTIRQPALRRRIWAELAVMVTFWSIVIAVTAYAHAWILLLVLYAAPAWLAGNMQSWRKYVEHMGLMGDKILTCTRTIVPGTRLGQFVVFTLFHEPYHGVHHTYPRLPHEQLPEFSTILEPPQDDEIPPFPNYRSAALDMLASLSDPRIGPQWRKQPQKTASHPEFCLGR
jgi:fatty acid desaturase